MMVVVVVVVSVPESQMLHRGDNPAPGSANRIFAAGGPQCLLAQVAP